MELGVSFIDTADSYGPVVSESLIGQTLAPYPKGLVIATKSGFTRQGPNIWKQLGRPEYLEQQVHMSLRWLNTDVIDLWQLHRIDPKVPVEESLEPIVRLQKQGKIRHVGLSEVKPHEIDQVRKVIDVVSVQNMYNLTERQHEDVLQYCEQHGLAFIPWFPVAAGKLAQPGGALDAIAKRHGVTVSQLSLAWLLHRSEVMLPIPGTSKVAHLEENMKAAGGQIVRLRHEGNRKSNADKSGSVDQPTLPTTAGVGRHSRFSILNATRLEQSSSHERLPETTTAILVLLSQQPRQIPDIPKDCGEQCLSVRT